MATQQQLTDAKNALHQLSIGKGVASIQKDGRRVEYTPARLSELRNYISQLESELAPRQQRRAFGVRL